jgi:hypothetical protein
MSLGLLALYGGPDQVMTVTSGIASLVGIVLVFWHKLVAFFFRVFERSQPPAESESQSTPEKLS